MTMTTVRLRTPAAYREVLEKVGRMLRKSRPGHLAEILYTTASGGPRTAYLVKGDGGSWWGMSVPRSSRPPPLTRPRRRRTMEKEQHETLTLARSLIRDMAMGWAPSELAAPPEEVVQRITALLGDEYDFKSGDES